MCKRFRHAVFSAPELWRSFTLGPPPEALRYRTTSARQRARLTAQRSAYYAARRAVLARVAPLVVGVVVPDADALQAAVLDRYLQLLDPEVLADLRLEALPPKRPLLEAFERFPRLAALELSAYKAALPDATAPFLLARAATLGYVSL